MESKKESFKITWGRWGRAWGKRVQDTKEIQKYQVYWWKTE